MTTAVEAALLKLLAGLQYAAQTHTQTLPPPTRNHEIATVLEQIGGSGTGLNLVDGETDVDDINIGDGLTYDLTHRPVIEWIVVNSDQAARDSQFDAGLKAIATLFEIDNTLENSVSFARIESISRSGHVTEGAPQIKSAAIIVNLTLQSRYPF